MKNMYRVFKRTLWRENSSWPNGLEPCAGEKDYVNEAFWTEDQARETCRVLNETLDKGFDERDEENRLSLKYEFEEV